DSSPSQKRPFGYRPPGTAAVSRRDWAKLWASLLVSPKWRALSCAQRDAWVTLVLVAVNTESGDRLGSHDTVVALLRDHGARDQADHHGLVAALLAAGWLDDEDGLVVIH